MTAQHENQLTNLATYKVIILPPNDKKMLKLQ